MEAAKSAISSFLHKDGSHKTDVDESVNPAVTSETVKPHRHEETTQAVDREIHQDHYHTTVQPIAHREVQPEQHTHNLAPQVERTIYHGDAEQDRSKVASELSQFQNTSTTAPTTHSTQAAPTAVGEHVHHHVHETVQPVIHKETVQPEVVHTTIPVHEKHHAPSEHHGISTLPMKTMDEVKNLKLTGGDRSREEYSGHPRPYNQAFQTDPAPVDRDPSSHLGTHDPAKTGHFGGSGPSSGVGQTAEKDLLSRDGSGPLHQSTDEHHGSGLGRGAAAAATTGAAGSALHSTGTSGHGTGATDMETGRLEGQRATAPSGGLGQSVQQPETVPEGFRKTAHGYHTNADEQPKTTNLEQGSLSGTGDEHNSRGLSHSEAETRPTKHEDEREPSNLEGGRAEQNESRDTLSKDIPAQDDNVQHASKMGEDPNMETKTGSKLTGSGVDGSHSAVFGLTPDGHKFDDTSKSTTTAPATSTEDSGENTSNKRDSGIDVGSRDASGGKVAEQMHDPRVAEKGHGGQAEYKGDADTKIGGGANVDHIV